MEMLIIFLLLIQMHERSASRSDDRLQFLTKSSPVQVSHKVIEMSCLVSFS